MDYNINFICGEGTRHMDDEVVISLSNVSKCFRRYGKPIDRLKEVLLSKKDMAEEFWVLNDLNLDVKRGETLGIIGQNGSGKSTLLQMIAGTMQPTKGSLKVRGQVSALLELGSGFNPEFTGRQNVFFNGRILGLSQKEIENRFDTIAAFADIGEYIDHPVKTYSSGMYVRLAFSVAVHVDSEVLIIDEALAVGDVMFQHRCMRKIKSLMSSGITTLFVSHDSNAVRALCSSAIMLDEGRIFAAGYPDQVMNQYLKKITDLEICRADRDSSTEELPSQPSEVDSVFRHSSISPHEEALLKSRTRFHLDPLSNRGNGKADITGVIILENSGNWAGPVPIVPFNERITIIVRVHILKAMSSALVGFLMKDKNGYDILGINTYEEKFKLESLQVDEQIDVSFQLKVPVRPGAYGLSVAIAETDASVTSLWLDNVVTLQVLAPRNGKTIHGMVDIPVEVQCYRRLNQLQVEPVLFQ